MWSIPDKIVKLLKKYTGEIKPTISSPKDNRRTFINEFSKVNQELVLEWFKSNKSLIINDIIKGRGQFAAEWMLVAQKVTSDARWVLVPINIVINHFDQVKVHLTKKGNLNLGKIGVQRKGGDRGRDSAKMLQFKLNPAELFDI